VERRGDAVMRERGFTLIEVLVAVAMLMVLTAAAVSLARAAQAASFAVGDMSDVQQRFRVAADVIQHDLSLAGAGNSRGGPLIRFLPPVRPAAGIGGDTDVTFVPDRMTVLYVPDSSADAELGAAPATLSTLPLAGPACVLDPSCGFAAGMQALVYDAQGPGFGYDVFFVADASAGVLSRTSGTFTRAYAPPSYASEVVQHTYYVDVPASGAPRLMRGDGRTAFPLIDGVQAVSFRYFADPDPSAVSPAGPPGGTCVYAPGAPAVPLLSPLGGASLSELTAAELTDGPFCGIAPNRFDADLLRIRRVRVSLRVDPPAAAGRRPSPMELSFDVAPRNLNTWR
jgi:prepilin-type N-terminal cleavage/methylation domain-containing protein